VVFTGSESHVCFDVCLSIVSQKENVCLLLRRWLRPWIRIVVSAIHIIDDAAFAVIYYLAGRKGQKKLYLTMSGMYSLGLLVAISSLVMTRIEGVFIENALFYVSFCTCPSRRF
jgi:hypothetical protein